MFESISRETGYDWATMEAGILTQPGYLRSRAADQLFEAAEELPIHLPPRVYLIGTGDSWYAGMATRLAFDVLLHFVKHDPGTDRGTGGLWPSGLGPVLGPTRPAGAGQSASALARLCRLLHLCHHAHADRLHL